MKILLSIFLAVLLPELLFAGALPLAVQTTNGTGVKTTVDVHLNVTNSASGIGSTLYVTNSSVITTDTNKVILTGADQSAVNTTWTWASTHYTNNVATWEIIFDNGSSLWFLNHGATLVYFANPPISSVDIGNFPFVWDVGSGSVAPTGTFGLKTNAQSRLVETNSQYFTLLPKGLETSYLLSGSPNSTLLTNHPDFPEAIVASPGSYSDGFDSITAGGNNNTNIDGVGNAIIGSSHVTMSGSGGESTALGAEFTYMSNSAGASASIAGLTGTNNAFSWAIMGAYLSSYMDTASENVAALGLDNSYINVDHGFISGSRSTNQGTQIYSIGDSNRVISAANIYVVGHSNTFSGNHDGGFGQYLTSSGSGEFLFGTGTSSSTSKSYLLTKTNGSMAFVFGSPVAGNIPTSTGTDGTVAWSNSITANRITLNSGNAGATNASTWTDVTNIVLALTTPAANKVDVTNGYTQGLTNTSFVRQSVGTLSLTSSTNAISDFGLTDVESATLTGNLNLYQTTNRLAGFQSKKTIWMYPNGSDRIITLTNASWYMTNNIGGTSRTFTLTNGWVGLLSINCIGSSETNVVAIFTVFHQ